MRFRSMTMCLLVLAAPLPAFGFQSQRTASAKPRPHELTIEGANDITFLAESELDPGKIECRVRIDYFVQNRSGAELEANAKSASKAKARSKVGRAGQKSRKADTDNPILSTVASALDIVIHEGEIDLRQDDQSILQSRMTRSMFQGRLLAGLPALTMSYQNAPPPVQVLMRHFDVPVASALLDDQDRVVVRQNFLEGSFRAFPETLLSLNTPIPADMSSWDGPTEIAMGQGQLAKGMLHFEKDKIDLSLKDGLVGVKVSGTLKAEGSIAGNSIKDSRYTVTGEQFYDPAVRDWKSVTWTIDGTSNLVDAAGEKVATTKGKMVVTSKMTSSAGTTGRPKTKRK